MKLSFVSKSLESENIWSLYFKPETKLRYIAGQFVEITIPHDHDDRGKMHWFTISSSPTDELVRITTRQAEGRISSFKRQLFNLSPGDQVISSSAMGDFVLPKDAAIPLVFVAVGIGITPFISIINYLDANHQTRDMKLIYKVKQLDNYAFKHQLEHNENINIFTTTDKLKVMDLAKIAQLPENGLMYLAGPEELVEVLTKDLAKQYYRPQQIVTDYFPGYA